MIIHLKLLDSLNIKQYILFYQMSIINYLYNLFYSYICGFYQFNNNRDDYNESLLANFEDNTNLCETQYEPLPHFSVYK